MFDYLKENRWFLGLCIAGIVMAMFGFGSLAKAQSVSSCHSRTAMGEAVLVCPDGLYQMLNLSAARVLVKVDTGAVDLRSCRPEIVNGAEVARCGQGLYEWQRRDGLLSLKPILVVTSDEAQRLIYQDNAQRHSSDYGYVPSECGVIIERNTQRCVDARWRRDRVVRCYGPYSRRAVYEAETCMRWAEQRRFSY